jgi:DNA helicase-2/ATP-dependent DNA helicase PcrA
VRVIAVPPRGIGEKTISNMQVAAMQHGISTGDLLLNLGKEAKDSPYWEMIGRSAAIVADFGGLLNEWLEAKGKTSLVSLFDRIVQDTGYEEYIKEESDAQNDRWENVVELRRLAYDFQEKGLTDFLQNLALVADQDTIPEESADADHPKGAVTLLTLHAAKGLEYNQLFINRLVAGLLPHSRSRDDPEEMAEERRLLYVGITRARNQLYLLRAERRASYGSWEYSEPSRFLLDISEDLFTRQGRSSVNRRGAFDDDLRWSTTGVTRRVTQEYSPSTRELKFKAGMRVKNAAWGEGLVLESKMDPDGEETVDIHFESVGFKRLLASLANLEILS